jgi:hypothetical protein
MITVCLKVRFFHCGEYGDLTRRPHYHALIFGYDFPDRILLKKSIQMLYDNALSDYSR